MSKKTVIITPCFNAHPALIWEHFISIDQQFDDTIIHVIVDDCSTRQDTRMALLAAAESRKFRTIVISSKINEGPGAARNKAIRQIAKMSNIEYACLLDIDDYFELDSIKIRKLVLEDDPSLIAVYGNKFSAKWEKIEDDVSAELGLEEVKKTLENVPLFDKPRLMRECFVPSCSVMFRWRPFIEHISSFREDVRLCEDWLVWRKLAMLGKFKKIDIPIYTQTMHGSNLTTNPHVLANHRRDMMITQTDFNEWLYEMQPKGILQL